MTQAVGEAGGIIPAVVQPAVVQTEGGIPIDSLGGAVNATLVASGAIGKANQPGQVGGLDCQIKPANDTPQEPSKWEKTKEVLRKIAPYVFMAIGAAIILGSIFAGPFGLAVIVPGLLFYVGGLHFLMKEKQDDKAKDETTASITPAGTLGNTATLTPIDTAELSVTPAAANPLVQKEAEEHLDSFRKDLGDLTNKLKELNLATEFLIDSQSDYKEKLEEEKELESIFGEAPEGTDKSALEEAAEALESEQKKHQELVKEIEGKFLAMRQTFDWFNKLSKAEFEKLPEDLKQNLFSASEEAQKAEAELKGILAKIES